LLKILFRVFGLAVLEPHLYLVCLKNLVGQVLAFLKMFL
jgi:hypothetical protein